MSSSIVTEYGQFASSRRRVLLADITTKDDGIQTGPFGSLLHKEDYVEVGTPIITVEHLGDNRIMPDGVPYVSDEDRMRLERFILRPGDIVFSRVGSVDRRALVRDFENGWLFSGRCLRVRPDPEVVDPAFLSYFLGLPNFKTYIRGIAVGATMPSLNTKILSEVPIYLPPLDEQLRIAEILGSLDDKIELNRRMNRTLEDLARAIFKSWFVDFDPVKAKMRGESPVGMDAETAALFPNRLVESDLGLIPEGWGVGTISDYCTVARGASPRPINNYMGGTVPWVKIADATASDGPFIFATKEKLKEEGVEKSVFLKRGSLILSNSATTGLPIYLEIDGCIHDGWLYFRNLERFSRNFLYHLLVTISDHLTSIADGSVQKNLNTKLVGSQILVLPSREVLHAFDEHTTPLFEAIRLNSYESRTLAETRDALLPKLMRGEVRV